MEFLWLAERPPSSQSANRRLVPPVGRSDVKVLQGVVVLVFHPEKLKIEIENYFQGVIVPVFHPGSGPLLEREIASQVSCAGLSD